ncbi:ATP-dependent Clp protease proteolytic subunit [Flavobacterium sp. N1994]|uniref:ATP-dependent Clp protease proteolytic subunit n=1 Tax=Flavobacterium sp. N1994 TaxID=2986827 RepID=UPI002221DE1F|nr:ATP-dependent Clp protease proteolytic subunit [Flavobacterium sp. N1994]
MKKHHVTNLLIVGGVSLTSALINAAIAEKFPLVITADKNGNKADIRITGALYNWNNSSEEITAKIDQFLADGVQDVDVYINSPGGDVFTAAEIENQIQRFPGAKNGIGGAIVASAATKIAISLDSFQMAENGSFMYHKPSGYFSGNEDAVQSSLELLKNLTAQYKEQYAAKTGLSVEDIESKWAKGDVWLTAKDAAKQKFITGVIKKTTITPDTKAMFEAFGAPNIPEVTSKINNQNNLMDKKIIALLLGLSEDASEEQIKAAITANKEAATKVTALTAEKKQAETAALETKVDALLNGAVTAKKILATQVESLKSWAKNDFDACEAHINSLQPLGKVSAAVTPSAGGAANVKAFKDMSEKERDELANEDPEAFKAAYLADLEGK